MFGNEYEIVREFNTYFLDYQEQYDADTRWTDRIISSSGDWSGNVYDFYFRVYNKLIQDIKVPFKMEGGVRVDDTSVHQALREALANCLVNADYYGRQGLVIIKKRDAITMANPGGFRIEIDAAKSGGVSDPRNGTMRPSQRDHAEDVQPDRYRRARWERHPQLLDAVSFTDKIIFGRTNYSKEISSYKNHKAFYSRCAKQVIAYCEERNIAYHIKNGTLTEQEEIS